MVEHFAYNEKVSGSNPLLPNYNTFLNKLNLILNLLRLMVRTLPFHGKNMSSILIAGIFNKNTYIHASIYTYI